MGSASSTSGRTDFGISAPACRFGRWGPAGLLARTGLFGDFFYALAAAFEAWALSSQCSLSSRKDRDGGVRCRLDHAFGSAHGRRQFSDRLLWITDASCLPKSVRCQSSARSYSKVVTFPIVLLSHWTGMKTFRTRGVLRLTERLVIKNYAVFCTPRRALG
jgi:hypothetical protein